MEVDHSLNRNLARVHPTPARIATGVPTRDGKTPTGQLRWVPGFERTDISGGAGVIRDRGLSGNSMDDEQWSDDLSIPSSH